VYAIDVANQLSVFNHTAWLRLPGGPPVSQISAGRDAHGNDQVYALDFTNRLWLVASAGSWHSLLGGPPVITQIRRRGFPFFGCQRAPRGNSSGLLQQSRVWRAD
jgi:hypothetical protein